MENFADRFIDAVKGKKNPSICGLDPDIGSLPPKIKEKYLSLFREGVIYKGDDYPDAVAHAILDFNKTIINAVHDIIPITKLQIAYYEKYGIPGLQVFMETEKYAKDKGMIVIDDSKRNDIDRTAKQYADGHIGEVEFLDPTIKFRTFYGDDMTVNAYFGWDGIKPFVEYCKDGKGIFALVKTTNPSSAQVQDRLILLEPEEVELIRNRLEDSNLSLSNLPAMKKNKDRIIEMKGVISLNEEFGKEVQVKVKYGDLPIAPLYVRMALLVDEWGSTPGVRGKDGYSPVGAVIGATFPEEAKVLRRLAPRALRLGPGYGSQGAMGEDAQNLFNEDGLGTGINNSSGLIFAYKKKPWDKEYGPDRYVEATRSAAISMRDDIVGALRKHGKWHLD